MLKKYGKAYGIDISDDAIRYCKIRGIKNVKKSNVMNIKFKNDMFDVVTSLGVFYHRNVRDDVRGMKEVHRVLKPGGRLIFFDCAMMCLFGKHDMAFDGARRYSKKELESKLKKAGFKLEEMSYINTLLFPAVFIKRKLEKFSKSSTLLLSIIATAFGLNSFICFNNKSEFLFAVRPTTLNALGNCLTMSNV
jgi:SAM-dependent methyltransferase